MGRLFLEVTEVLRATLPKLLLRLAVLDRSSLCYFSLLVLL